MSALRRGAVTMGLLQDQVLPRRIFLAASRRMRLLIAN
jgi:hypothetical protein